MSQRALSLEKVLELPLPSAIRALSKFPMIGKPGAEKMNRFCSYFILMDR